MHTARHNFIPIHGMGELGMRLSHKGCHEVTTPTLNLLKVLRSAAPLADMYAYLRKECEEQRRLRLEEYGPSFLSWAGRYLQTSPAVIASRGESIAVAAVKKIGQRTSRALYRKRGTDKDLIASAKQHTGLDSTSNRPKPSSSKSSGQKRRRAASMAISTGSVDEHHLENIQPITITAPTDRQQGINIGQDELVSTQNNCDEPRSSVSSKALDDQQTEALRSLSPDRITVPLPTGQGEQSLSQDDYNGLHSSDSSMTGDDQENDTLYSLSIDEVAIPMPIDNQCKDYPQDTSPEAGNEADVLEGFDVTLFHVCPVQLL